MRHLLARNAALRGLVPWLVVMLVGAQVVTGVYGVLVFKTGTVTSTPLLIGAWMLLAVYLTWGQVRHRCSRFDLALPLAARDLWTASLVGSLLAGGLVLAMVLAVVLAVFWLLGSRNVFDTVSVGDVARVGAILAGALIAGTVWRYSRHADRASAPGGPGRSLVVFASLLVALPPMIALQQRPELLVPLQLAVAAILVVTTRRRLGEGYVLEPLAAAARGGTGAATGPGLARPAHGPRAAWLHYQMIVRTAPKGPALIILLLPFMLIFGVVLSGLLLRLMPGSDYRFAYLPLTAYMALTFAAPLAANLRAVDALPLGRRYLLALITIPVLGVLCVGYLGGVLWMNRTAPVPPKIVFSEDAPGYGVRVPTYMWRLSWTGEAPPATSPTGETHPVATISLIKGATPLVYKPYTTPVGSSQAFVAWQIWRAAGAMSGTRLTPAEIEDRYLWTDADGRVRLKTDALDLHGDGWVIAARSAGPFLPVTVALVAVLMYLGLAVYAPAIRAGVSKARRQARLWMVLGALLLVHLTPFVLVLTHVSRPWVLERVGTELMLRLARAVPGGYPGLWIAALLVGAAAFEGAHLAFERAESPVQPDSCMWNSLSKGD